MYNILYCTYVQADTSLLEERHRQQLRDLEEAMKSTWEAKSKVRQHTYAHTHTHTHKQTFTPPLLCVMEYSFPFPFPFSLPRPLFTSLYRLHNKTYRPFAFSMSIYLSICLPYLTQFNHIALCLPDLIFPFQLCTPSFLIFL